METIVKLNDFARRVMWRARLLALQDALAWGIGAGGFIAASLIFYIRWKAIQTPVWLVALAVFAAIFGAFITRWSIKRANANDAGFLIDEKLDIEDRFASSQAILAKSASPNEVEQALIEDAATRIETAKPSTILPYRLKPYYSFSLVALLALSAAILIPQKTLPGGEEILQAQADIQAAGEVLEKSSTEIEKFVPPDTVTANLAKEQAELGRSLRRSSDTRAEALKKLSSLEDRIRQRHEELKSTRADDIVTLAQRRLGATLAQMGKPANQTSGNEKAQASGDESSTTATSKGQKSSGNKTSETQPSSDNAVNQSSGETVAKAGEKNGRSAAERKAQSSKSSTNPVAKQNPNDAKAKPDAANNVTAQTTQSAAANQPPAKNSPEAKQANSQKSANTASPDNSTIAKEQTAEKTKPSPKEQSQNTGQPNQSDNAVAQNQTTNNQQPNQPQNEQAKQQGNEQATQENPDQAKSDAANPLTTAVADQTAKALPQLSEQLLKKAQELRDGKMSAEDIKRLALSAGQLAKDLAPIAQSKEFQKNLEELAKQVNPQQLEAIARALMQDEKLQRELKAAAKLLMENREVKDMVAGLTKTGAEIANDFRKQSGEETPRAPQPNAPQSAQPGEPLNLGSNRKSNEKGQQNGQPGQGTNTTRVESQRKLAGQGRAATISGQMQNRPGGDYVFSGVKPGAGAARIPYSSAYPQYRRQAERTVERSQVPTQMRSMIRNYFDAINPNGKN